MRRVVTGDGPTVTTNVPDSALKAWGVAIEKQAQQAQILAEAMAPALARLTTEIKQAEEVLGCSYDEIIGDPRGDLQVEACNVTHDSTVDLDDPVRRRGIASQPRPTVARRRFDHRGPAR